MVQNRNYICSNLIQKVLPVFGYYGKSLTLKLLWDVGHVLKCLEPTLSTELRSRQLPTCATGSSEDVLVEGKARQVLVWSTDSRGWV